MPTNDPSPVRTDDFLAASGDPAPLRAQYERFPQLAVLTTQDDEPEDLLRAGTALEHLLLTATASGLAASFLCQPIELYDMLEGDPPDWAGPASPQMIIRLGYPVRPALPAPRRSRDEILAQRAASGGRR